MASVHYHLILLGFRLKAGFVGKTHGNMYSRKGRTVTRCSVGNHLVRLVLKQSGATYVDWFGTLSWTTPFSCCLGCGSTILRGNWKKKMMKIHEHTMCCHVMSWVCVWIIFDTMAFPILPEAAHDGAWSLFYSPMLLVSKNALHSRVLSGHA